MSCCRSWDRRLAEREKDCFFRERERERLFLYLKCKRRSSWVITFYSLTILVNKKLGKVPLNVVAEDSPFAFLQELIQRRSILSVYFNLIHNGKYSIVFEKPQDIESCNGFVEQYTLLKMGNSDLNRVHTKSVIWSVVPGSSSPNWLQGNARISRPATEQHQVEKLIAWKKQEA